MKPKHQKNNCWTAGQGERENETLTLAKKINNSSTQNEPSYKVGFQNMKKSNAKKNNKNNKQIYQ